MDNNELVPTMAKLTITYGGQQGDLPDPVSYDATDGDLKQMAAESVRQGYVPGIDAVQNVDFTDFVVDRFPARNDVPFNRLSLRPKTPFGAAKKKAKKAKKREKREKHDPHIACASWPNCEDDPSRCYLRNGVNADEDLE
jgi:hypothetical protein